MKKRELTKSIVVHLMIFSLVQTSFPTSVTYAAEIEKNPLFQAAGLGIAIYGQAMQSQQQLNAQLRAYQATQKQLQSLRPVPTPSRFFPQCNLPPSMVNYPKNICEANSQAEIQNKTAAGTLGKLFAFEQSAEQAANYYEQMLNEASNAPIAQGMRCLKDNQKAVNSQLMEMMNNLTRLQDRLNQDKDVFAANTKDLLNKYGDLNTELNGGESKSNSLKTKDYSALYGSTCKNIIGKEAFSNAGKDGSGPGFIGYKNVLNIMRSNETAAGNFNDNRARIKSDIQKDIQNMQLSIKNAGVADWINMSNANNGADFSNMPALKNAAGKAVVEFNTSYTRISNELKKQYNYDVPALDKNFSADFADFVSSSKDYFKKKYVNDCVTGADKGIAIPVDQLIGSMKTTIQGSPGEDYLKTFRAKYKEIMQSSESVDEKETRLKNLVKTFPDIQVRYANNNAGIITERPYDTFMKTAQKCAENYTYNQEKKVDRGQVLLRELQSLHDNFASNLGQAVVNKFENCNGEEKKAGATCNEDTLNHKNQNFCMSQAEVCSNEILGCAKVAEKIVNDTQNEMKKMATAYNASVQNVIARSNSLLENQKTAVNEILKLVQAKFPGSNIEIPKDLFVPIPPMNNNNGEQLYNDGNLSFLNDLPKRIDSLKEMLDKQNKAANEQIDDYIALQEGAMRKEKDRLSKIASDCKSAADKLGTDVANFNAKGAEENQKRMAAAGSWCAKYDDLKTHPNGACDKAKALTKDMDKVVGMITTKARTLANEMQDVCNQYNNEKDDDPVSTCQAIARYKKQDAASDEQKREYIDNNCDKILARASRGNSGKPQKEVTLEKLCKEGESEKDFFTNIANLLPQDKAALSGIDSMKGLSDLLEKGKLTNTDFFEELVDMYGKSDQKICTFLNEKNKVDDSAVVKQIEEKKETIAKLEEEAGKEKDEEKKKLKVKDIDTAKAAVAELEKQKKVKLAASTPVTNLLKNFYPPAETMDELKLRKIGEVGEQVDGSCLAQASNNNMPKFMDPSSILPGFDASILGKSQ